MSNEVGKKVDVDAWIKDIESDHIEQKINPAELPLKKRLFYASMIKTFGNVTQSCMIAGIKRATYRNWLRDDKIFAELMQKGDFEERLLDFAESKLMEKINSGDIIAILFTLKTKGKKRGYIEGNDYRPPVDQNKSPSWFDDGETSQPKLTNTKSITEIEIVEENASADLDKKTA